MLSDYKGASRVHRKGYCLKTKPVQGTHIELLKRLLTRARATPSVTVEEKKNRKSEPKAN